MQVPAVAQVLVATDDERVRDVALAFGAEVVMTSPEHASGTDRLVEVMSLVAADLYINLQGDEPLIRPEDVSLLLLGMQSDSLAQVGTLCHPLDVQEARQPSVVKLVRDMQGYALYFSRSLIPFPREASQASYLKHVGVYAYRKPVLQAYSRLPPSMLEQAESLEQLRLLQAGVRIRCFEVAPTGPGVDTPACLARVRRIMAGAPEQEMRPTLADIRLLIADVDGVLTDGGIYYDANGECVKRFHVRDGMGIRLLEEQGVRVAVVSGRDSATLRKRLADLGVTLCRLGVRDKAAACRELMAETSIAAAQTACIGDDCIDLPAFAVCGLSFAVADAPEYVRHAAAAVLHLPGGAGALRELADAILLAQGKGGVLQSAEGFLHGVNKVAQ